jgi:hypothetical protein
MAPCKVNSILELVGNMPLVRTKTKLLNTRILKGA